MRVSVGFALLLLLSACAQDRRVMESDSHQQSYYTVDEDHSDAGGGFDGNNN